MLDKKSLYVIALGSMIVCNTPAEVTATFFFFYYVFPFSFPSYELQEIKLFLQRNIYQVIIILLVINSP